MSFIPAQYPENQVPLILAEIPLIMADEIRICQAIIRLLTEFYWRLSLMGSIAPVVNDSIVTT
jgi:hypothetical protein